MSIEKLKQNYPVEIRWIHFPLHPETPQEGKSLAELFAGRDITAIREKMKALMAEAGLDYGERSHTYNSRLAQELGKWADGQLGGEAIHDALYRAYFVDNKNIAEVNELVAIAKSVGLDAGEAHAAIAQRKFKNAVDEDWRRCREVGVSGVPTFFGNGLVVVGCQPYQTLEKFVQHLLNMNSAKTEDQ